MMYFVFGFVGIVLSLSLGLAWKLLRRPSSKDYTWDSSGISAAERYAPMLRLLNEEDFEYLRSRPGYDPKVGWRLRRERYRLFREYLESMRREFHGIQRILRFFAVHSSKDEALLVSALLKHQWAFNVLLARVEVRALLFALGWPGIDATPLLAAFTSLRDSVQDLCRIRLGADCALEQVAII